MQLDPSTASVYATGTFEGTVAIGSNILTSNGGRDIWVSLSRSPEAHWGCTVTTLFPTPNRWPALTQGMGRRYGVCLRISVCIAQHIRRSLWSSSDRLVCFRSPSATIRARSFGGAFSGEAPFGGIALDSSGDAVYVVGSHTTAITVSNTTLAASPTIRWFGEGLAVVVSLLPSINTDQL
jgi:hypothetical protein